MDGDVFDVLCILGRFFSEIIVYRMNASNSLLQVQDFSEILSGCRIVDFVAHVSGSLDFRAVPISAGEIRMPLRQQPHEDMPLPCGIMFQLIVDRGLTHFDKMSGHHIFLPVV